MFAKPLLKAAVSLVAIAALTVASCATPTAGGASAQAGAATPEAAREFVANAERELRAMSEREARIAWTYSTYINFDTEWLAQWADSQGTQARVRYASEAARFADTPLDPETRRKIDLLRLALTLPAPQREGAADQLAAVNSRMSSLYSTSRIDYQGRQVSLDELENLMGTERNPARLQEMWTKWHDISRPMAADYQQMVTIANEGARELGYPNIGDYWLSNYDMPPEQMEQEVERLWGQMQPFYEQLHCYVRTRLNAHYGDAVQPASGPIRADLLGNMWAQEWGNISDIVGPPVRGGYDLTRLLEQQDYDARRLVETGERFYTSLGLAELPDTFWERSQFTRPRDRDVVCHASAWDLDYADDLRIKMCITVNADDFQVVHHELGHNYYQRAYNQLPVLFQDGAHDGFHEAIGDFVALNATPDYLVQIGLLRQNQAPSAEADNALLMRQALDKIAFLPFALSLDQWRWRVFRGQIQPADYNTAWWQLRQQYQGITPPGGPRPADAFDPGAKYHVANNVPYLRYFLARVLQFQFYEAACQQAGWTGPLHRCTVFGNEEVGARFNAMMEMGRSRPWPDALEAFTGTRQMDGSSMVHYFQPLMTWMEAQNRGQDCGWD
ncbi:MAG: M2 family metallopeptidase [Hyphomonadaceae bacterium]|nr:M2 family metallopeptidase [Hyphomonadaceae bacterium]